MERLWASSSPLSVRDVLEALRPGRDLAYTTVMTVLDNLHGKSMVVREKDGRAYRYAAAHSREEHTASLLQGVLATGGDHGATLLRFVGDLPADDLRELRAALDALEGRS